MKKALLIATIITTAAIGAQAQTSTTATQTATLITTEQQHTDASHTSTTTDKPKPGMPAPVEKHTVTKWHYHKGAARASDKVPPKEEKPMIQKWGTEPVKR